MILINRNKFFSIEFCPIRVHPEDSRDLLLVTSDHYDHLLMSENEGWYYKVIYRGKVKDVSKRFPKGWKHSTMHYFVDYLNEIGTEVVVIDLIKAKK